MATATIVTLVTAFEPQTGEPGVDDRLSYFADEASAERVNPGRGALWGLVLGGGLWIGIFAVAAHFIR
jgi:hypothetical protein